MRNSVEKLRLKGERGSALRSRGAVETTICVLKDLYNCASLIIPILIVWHVSICSIMCTCVDYTQNYVQFVHRHRADFLSRVDVTPVHMIIWFRPLEVSLGELSVQWCYGSTQRCRTDGQMWTDRPTDPWLIVHLSAPPAESLGRSTVLCCSSIFPSLISHACFCFVTPSSFPPLSSLNK